MVSTERRWSDTAVDFVLSHAGQTALANPGEGGKAYPPGTIVFGSGNPDPGTLPADGLLQAATRALEDKAYALTYGPAHGDMKMREWLAARLNAQEHAGVGPENFFITSGSWQGVQMTLNAFLNPGDPILVEAPSFAGSLRVFRGCGAVPVGVAMDEQGVLPAALEETVQRLTAEGRRPKLFYTMPTVHNPTALTTPLSRREAVVDVCDRYGVLIMEDDAYGEIRFEGVRPPSYYTVAGGHGALRLSTVSKMLATGLRVGWITARKDFVDAFARMRFDGGLSPFLIRTVAEYCASGDEDRHLEAMIPLYREKRDRMLAALAERCSGTATWGIPEGGFFLWLKVAGHIDPDTLADAMVREGISARRGDSFFADGSGKEYLRLCYSVGDFAMLEEGVRRLARALDASVRS